MARYRPVDLRLWADRKFLALPDDARLLWLFLLTTPSTLPIPGVIVAGEAALAEQLGWTTERFRERFHDLTESGLAVRREGRVVWLKNALRYQPPANPNTVKCWAKAWDDVPEGSLKEEIREELKIACKSWSRLFEKLFGRGTVSGTVPGTVNGSGNRSGNRYTQEQEQDQDQDQEREESALSRARAGAREADPEPTPPRPETPETARAERERSAPTPDLRIKINHDAWRRAAEEHARLRQRGIDPSAIGWPSMPCGEAQSELVARTREIIARGEDPAVVHRRRVAVAVAEAEREQHLRWFTPTQFYAAERFWRAAELSPEQARTARRSAAGVAPAPLRMRDRADDAPYIDPETIPARYRGGSS